MLHLATQQFLHPPFPTMLNFLGGRLLCTARIDRATKQASEQEREKEIDGSRARWVELHLSLSLFLARSGLAWLSPLASEVMSWRPTKKENGSCSSSSETFYYTYLPALGSSWVSWDERKAGRKWMHPREKGRMKHKESSQRRKPDR